MKKRKTAVKTFGALMAGILLLGITSQVMAAEYGDDFEVLLLGPNVTRSIQYNLGGTLQDDLGNFHTTYIIAIPDLKKPAPLDITITTTPAVKSPDGATVLSDVLLRVDGIIDVTPTYKFGYASGGLSQKITGIQPAGIGVIFTYGVTEVNDPVYPITVKQKFECVPTPKK